MEHDETMMSRVSYRHESASLSGSLKNELLRFTPNRRVRCQKQQGDGHQLCGIVLWIVLAACGRKEWSNGTRERTANPMNDK